MTIKIAREVIDLLGFDLAEAVDAFQTARQAHALTVGQPAPNAHPLVEQIVLSGQPYEIVEPTPAPEPPPITLVAYAADMRWQKEIGGIVVAGVPIATDDRSKLMITGARVAAMADPNWSTVWHGADGNTYPIDVAAMVAISDAVQGHVNATFQTFASVKAAIEAGTITTPSEIDAAFA